MPLKAVKILKINRLSNFGWTERRTRSEISHSICHRLAEEWRDAGPCSVSLNVPKKAKELVENKG
jgi:hypothetical protein